MYNVLIITSGSQKRVLQTEVSSDQMCYKRQGALYIKPKTQYIIIIL